MDKASRAALKEKLVGWSCPDQQVMFGDEWPEPDSTEAPDAQRQG